MQVRTVCKCDANMYRLSNLEKIPFSLPYRHLPRAEDIKAIAELWYSVSPHEWAKSGKQTSNEIHTRLSHITTECCLCSLGEILKLYKSYLSYMKAWLASLPQNRYIDQTQSMRYSFSREAYKMAAANIWATKGLYTHILIIRRNNESCRNWTHIKRYYVWPLYI